MSRASGPQYAGSSDSLPFPDEYTQREIRIRAYQLIRTSTFTWDDLEDIQQELTLYVLQRIPSFDPARGRWKAFVSAVLDHHIVHLIERRTAQKRDRKREQCSLDEQVRDTDSRPVPRASTLPCTGMSPDPDLEMDLTDALSALPPELRRLCERLQVATVSEVAREFGIARKTVYAWLKRVRVEFKKRGLKDYF